MKRYASIFLADEGGAISVDWVVLTASIIGLSLAVIVSIQSGAIDYSTSLGNSLSSKTVATY
jgi:hypothetical protein